jgi:hypothetical protein
MLQAMYRQVREPRVSGQGSRALANLLDALVAEARLNLDGTHRPEGRLVAQHGQQLADGAKGLGDERLKVRRLLQQRARVTGVKLHVGVVQLKQRVRVGGDDVLDGGLKSTAYAFVVAGVIGDEDEQLAGRACRRATDESGRDPRQAAGECHVETLPQRVVR